MRREWGGCAGNIAYNLRGIGGEPVVMATVGDDGVDYRERLASLGIGIDGVRHVPGAYTAQAFIITDLDDNQITAFHPGAMTPRTRTASAMSTGIGLGIVAPDGKDGMQPHVAQFAAAGIPFIFDPGQGMPLFSGDGAARDDRQGALRRRQRLRRPPAAERTGLPLAAIARACRRADRHAGRPTAR